MTRRRLTDAELAAAPKERALETLKKRAQRARKKAAVALSLAPPPPRVDAPPSAIGEVINGIDPADPRTRDLYLDLRRRLQRAGRWNGEASHGLLLTFVKSTRAIESTPPEMLPGHVFTAQRGAATALRLHELPADKPPRAPDRFTGGDWSPPAL